MEFSYKEEYLKAIKRELYQNHDGFRADTISKDPDLRKSVDDLYYGECGVDNHKTIEHYKNAVDIETTPPINESNKQKGIRM